MDKPESLEEFYKRKFKELPDNLHREIGHFNVFRLDPFVGDKPDPVPYKPRDFYKIMLVTGSSRVHYADCVVEVAKQAHRPRLRAMQAYRYPFVQVNRSIRAD